MENKLIEFTLIANFLKWEKVQEKIYMIPNLFPNHDKNNKEYISENVSNFKFNTQWDWLMPIIKLISKENFENNDYIYPRTFGMIDEEGYFMFRFNKYQLFKAKIPIEAAFNAVINYLQLNYCNHNYKQITKFNYQCKKCNKIICI